MAVSTTTTIGSGDTTFTSPFYLTSSTTLDYDYYSVTQVSLQYQNPGPSNLNLLVNHATSLNSGLPFTFQGNTFTVDALFVKTSLYISQYTFSAPSARLGLSWQLYCPDAFYLTKFSNSTVTIFTLAFNQSENSAIFNGMLLIFNNQAVVDGYVVDVEVYYNQSTQQVTAIFPNFVNSVLYDPIIGFASPPSSLTTTGDGYDYGSSGGDGALEASIIVPAVLPAIIVIFVFFCLMPGIAFCIIFRTNCKRRQMINLQKQQQLAQVEMMKAPSRKEVEALWALSQGKTRDGKKHFFKRQQDWKSAKAEDNEVELDQIESGRRGTGGMSMVPNLWQKKAKYYLEFLPPETVELVACFVEGKPQHNVHQSEEDY